MIKLTKLITEMKEVQEIEDSPIPNTKNLTGCRVRYTGMNTTKGKPGYFIYGQDGRYIGSGHKILIQTANDPDGTHAVLTSDFKKGHATAELVLDKDFEIDVVVNIEKDDNGYWEYIKFVDAEYDTDRVQDIGPARPVGY